MIRPATRVEAVMRVVECTETTGASVELDPYVPAVLRWDTSGRPSLLYVFVRGGSGGYLEFKVDESTGALVELVVVEIPPYVESAALPREPDQLQSGAPVLDLSLWPTTETPDYSEISSRAIDLSAELRLSNTDSGMAIWLSSEPEARYIDSYPVRIGVGEDDQLVSVRLDGFGLSEDRHIGATKP